MVVKYHRYFYILKYTNFDGDNMDNNFYNLLNYYRSINIAKKLVEQKILTQDESQNILDKLKQYYDIDNSEISDL